MPECDRAACDRQGSGAESRPPRAHDAVREQHRQEAGPTQGGKWQVRAPANDAAAMGRPNRGRRTGAHTRRGLRRADAISTRLGTGLREGRLIDGSTQQLAADRSGISQPRWSELERGLGRSASIETWALAAAAVGLQLAAFLEGGPGADRPRDFEYLRRQDALVRFAARSGWAALPELAIDPSPRSRSIEVVLVRLNAREAIAAEIWDWFDDVGAAFRGLDAKTRLLRARLEREHPGDQPWKVRGLFVVRGTRRNRLLLQEVAALFAARFPGSSKDWLCALADPNCAVSDADGVCWGDASGQLQAVRLRPR